jgi:ADP-heptose:LPS heptosyltransferase
LPSVSSRSQLRQGLLRLAARLLPIGTARIWNSRPRILLIRPDHIGDVLLSADAIGLLRASLPTAELTYLVGPWSAAAARYGPRVDDVRVIAFPGFTRGRNANLVAPYVLLAQEAAKLRRERFDAALVLRPDHWWGGLLALAAGIPVRVGTLTPETAPLLTHAYARGAGEHAAQTSLAVARLTIEALSATTHVIDQVAQFTVPRGAEAKADTLWNGLNGKRVIGLHPAAGAQLKSWPIDRWASLANCLLAEGASIALIGGPSDRELLESIHQRTRGCATVFCGQPLEVSAALYARCALVVSVDSGAGHLAAAVGVPTVRLYGPAPPSVFGPWPCREDQQVLMATGLACAPCGHLEEPPCRARTSPACMLALGVEDVLKAVRAQLRRG